MLFNPKHDNRPGLTTGPHALEPAVPDDIVVNAFALARRSGRAGRAERVDQLIEAGAWTDAALALLEAALPAWKLRRLDYEDGEWHCCLSRQPGLPVEIDDTADACHELLPVAIIHALDEARRKTGSCKPYASVAPSVRRNAGYLHCCDNFA
jgi:hypothetical protein